MIDDTKGFSAPPPVNRVANAIRVPTPPGVILNPPATNQPEFLYGTTNAGAVRAQNIDFPINPAMTRRRLYLYSWIDSTTSGIINFNLNILYQNKIKFQVPWVDYRGAVNLPGQPAPSFGPSNLIASQNAIAPIPQTDALYLWIASSIAITGESEMNQIMPLEFNGVFDRVQLDITNISAGIVANRIWVGMLSTLPTNSPINNT